jgi:hypothetical protein
MATIAKEARGAHAPGAGRGRKNNEALASMGFTKADLRALPAF